MIVNEVLIQIPILNVLGAVISTTGCYLVAAVFDVCMLSRITEVRFDWKRVLLKPVAGAIVMGVAALGIYHGLFYFVPYNVICTLTAIVAAMGIYAIVMLWIGGIQEEDLQAMPMGGKLVRICKKVRLL